MKFDFFKEYPQLRSLWLAMFTDVLGMSIIIPILPTLATLYHIDTLLLGFLISSNAIFGLIISPIYGKLSDKYGRKPIIIFCQIGTLIGFLVLTFSTSIFLLFLARIIDGLFGGQLTTCQAVVSDIVPHQDRGKIMTTLGSAITFAYIFGPSIGGLVFQIFQIHGNGIFGLGILAVIIASFNLLFTKYYLCESHPGFVQGKLVNLIAQIGPPSIEVKDESTGKKILKPIPLNLKNQGTLYILILYCVFILTAAPFETTISLFGAQYMNFSISDIGILFTTMAIFQVIFRTTLFGRIHKKIGDTKSVLLGFLIYITAYLFLNIKINPWYFAVMMWYITLGAVFTRGIIVGFASRTVDKHTQGKLMGITTAIESGGQIIGPFIGVYLLLDFSVLLYLMALMIISIVAFCMSFRLFRYGFDTKAQKEA